MPRIRERAKFNWSKQPLVRPVISYILGILVHDKFYFLNSVPTSLLLSLILILLIHVKIYRMRLSAISCCIHAAFFLIGCITNSGSHCRDNSHDEFCNQQFLVRQIGETQIRKVGNQIRTDLIAESIFLLEGTQRIKSKKRIRFSIFGDQIESMPGTYYLAHASVKKPHNDLFPGSFDFETFCRHRSIDAICTIKSQALIPLNIPQADALIPIIRLRNKIVDILYDAGFTTNQAGIASALLIGARSEIDPELNLAYSRAGIVHVLAVSGMHVSLVFGSVLWLLSKLLRQKQAILIGLMVLWLYALLAGMSASVVRSAWMFTLIAGSKLLVGSVNSSNAMAGAALIMLCIRPSYLFDPGAQLSFAAVWAIQVCSKPPISLQFKNRILKYFIDSLWICVVAQLATLPFTIAYFGKFPVYFLIANLVAVPLSTCIIYLGIFSLIVSPITYLGDFAFSIVKWDIDALNAFTVFISELPFSSFDFRSINTISVVVFGFAIFVVFLPLLRLKHKLLLSLIFKIIHALFILFECLVPDKARYLYFSQCKTHSHALLHFQEHLISMKFGNVGEPKCRRDEDLVDFSHRQNRTVQNIHVHSNQVEGIYSIVNHTTKKQGFPIFVFLPDEYSLMNSKIISGRTFVWGNSKKSRQARIIYTRHYKIPLQLVNNLKTVKYPINF